MTIETTIMDREPGGSAIRVAVGVLTYRRPEVLSDTLVAIESHLRNADLSQQLGVPVRTEILVVDNDPEATARVPVRRLDIPGVRYVVEPRPGIAAARNRAMAEASGFDVLAFIDDDEVPVDGWLSNLLIVWRRIGAAGVAGRVVPQYAVEPDPWIIAGRFFVRRTMPTGTPRPAAAAGNLLLDVRQVRRSGVTFAEPFGLTGGEDTIMTRRMTAAGLQIVWCDESVVKDRVPVDRLTRDWVLRRAWSHGNNQSLIEIHLIEPGHRRVVTRLKNGVTGSGRIAAGAMQYARGRVCGNLRDQARGTRMIWRGAGIVAGSLGVAYEEYARSHSADAPVVDPGHAAVESPPMGEAEGACLPLR